MMKITVKEAENKNIKQHTILKYTIKYIFLVISTKNRHLAFYLNLKLATNK